MSFDPHDDATSRGAPDAAVPWRVFVSGFLDWPRDGEAAVGFDPWRCTQNSSGYLLIGRWHQGGSKPDPGLGPLSSALRAVRRTRDGRRIEWTFDALPTRWGAAAGVPASAHDVVVNLGLGVYPDRFGDAYEATILVEVGARNLRARGPDVAGVSIGDAAAPPPVIEEGGPEVLLPPPLVAARARNAAGEVAVGGTSFTVIAEGARDENAFVCNETHHAMLSQLGAGARPHQAYFIHVPRPRDMRRGRPLAKALRTVIEGLIQPGS